MRYSAPFGLLLSATLGCAPSSHSDDAPPDFVTGGAAGAMGTGGTAGAMGGSGGASGSGFVTLAGVDPATQLDRLAGPQLVQACNEFAQYFSSQVPNADIVRGNCVQDAVFTKGKTTVAECQQASGECIAAAAPIPPIQCSEPAAGFTCSATIALYEQCGTDLTAAEKILYGLLVCQSLDDPAIQQKLDPARAGSASCTTFTQTCPSFFPVPNTGAGGAGGAIGAGGTAGFSTGGLPSQAGAGGVPPGGFTTLSGVDPGTPLDQLSNAQYVQACNEYAQYFSSQVPNGDIIRGNCVQDAVFVKGATTVAQCQQVSGTCISSATPIPPIQCADRPSGFVCPATVQLYQQCGSELASSQKTLYGLLVCESIDDPSIQQKLDAARAPSASCTSFTQVCPNFFPTPAP